MRKTRPGGGHGDVEPWVVSILRSLRQILRRVEIGSSELEAAHGVTQPQLVCLRTIAAQRSITQVELARAVHLSASTLVGIIDRLELKKLVLRERDREDRRRVLLCATAAGMRKVRTAPEPLHQQVQRALVGLEPDELAAVSAALARLVDLLGAGDAEAPPLLASGPIPKPQALESRRRRAPRSR